MQLRFVFDARLLILLRRTLYYRNQRANLLEVTRGTAYLFPRYSYYFHAVDLANGALGHA